MGNNKIQDIFHKHKHCLVYFYSQNYFNPANIFVFEAIQSDGKSNRIC